MDRRTFCRYIALSTTFFGGIVGRDLAIAATPPRRKARYKWIVLYWMPYDNDLTRFGEPILEMLKNGTQNPDIAVIVQSDYYQERKMRRRLLTNESIKEINVTGNDSSNISGLSEYLNWANQNFQAEHWIVSIVGHGGKINEISPDDSADKLKTRKWMGVDQFTNAVSNFNRATNGKVELLFFQNCNKATLEVVYQARHCARYTLASQLELGAPNYYYHDFLKTLQKTSFDGRTAAIAIANSERDNMYHSLTLIDNKAIQSLPVKLSRLLRLLPNTPLTKNSRSQLQTYYQSEEQHCDLLLLLDYFSQSGNRERKEFAEFSNFLRSSVITYYKTGGKLYSTRIDPLGIRDVERLSGLSVYFPETEADITRYRSLDLYREVDLISFYRKLFPHWED